VLKYLDITNNIFNFEEVSVTYSYTYIAYSLSIIYTQRIYLIDLVKKL